MWQSLEILNVLNTVILKQIYKKTKTFFKELEYRFLVESSKILAENTNIENATFPYKIVLTKANVKTIIMRHR